MSYPHVLEEVQAERSRQDTKWGQQSHPDGTGFGTTAVDATWFRQVCDQAFKNGVGTWRDILQEEVSEAFAESDPARLREELIQVAAVATAWVEAIDRRAEDAPSTESRVDKAERREDLRCSLCPPNRKENSKRKPKSDVHKSRRKK